MVEIGDKGVPKIINKGAIKSVDKKWTKNR